MVVESSSDSSRRNEIPAASVFYWIIKGSYARGQGDLCFYVKLFSLQRNWGKGDLKNQNPFY